MTTTEREPASTAQDDREVRRTVAREFRPRRTVPAVIVAGLLALAAILVAVELVSQLIGQPLNLLPVDDLARLGRETAWNDPLAFTVAGVAIALGLLLLFLALYPGRVRASALAAARPGVVTAIGTADLQRLAVHAAESVPGVDRATARAQNGRIAVRAHTSLHEPGDLDDRVARAVTERLERLSLQRAPRVRVTVRHREE